MYATVTRFPCTALISGRSVAAGAVEFVVTVAAPVSNVPVNTPDTAVVSSSVRLKPVVSLEDVTFTVN